MARCYGLLLQSIEDPPVPMSLMVSSSLCEHLWHTDICAGRTLIHVKKINRFPLYLYFCLCLSLETRSWCVAQAGIEFTMCPKLASNSRFPSSASGVLWLQVYAAMLSKVGWLWQVSKWPRSCRSPWHHTKYTLTVDYQCRQEALSLIILPGSTNT